MKQLRKLSLAAGLALVLMWTCTSPTQNQGSGSAGPVNSLSAIASKPSVTLPAGMSGTVQVAPSSRAAPSAIDSAFCPVGQAYEVTLQGHTEGVSFGSKYAVLTFNYDKNALQANKLVEEFGVFYFDMASQTWKPVNKVEVDTAAARITAYTTHFTTFVAAAAAVQPTGVLPPPADILSDYPTGLGGSGNAVLSLLGQGFFYYQDRTFFVRPLTTSTVNTATFAALGFDGALGISTSNGVSANDPVNPFSAHKLFTGTNYVSFVAKRDLDVYVMYDTRGGSGPTDLSADAPWLAVNGFSADISTPTNPTPRRYFVETSDPVGQYKVYKKTFLSGSTVTLDGNRRGVTDAGIQTNYWVIVKKKDDFSNNSASGVSTSPDTTAPGAVTNLTASAGNGTVSLDWTPPADTDFNQVFVTFTPGGTTPFVVPRGTNNADIPGLVNGTNYTFLVQAVDTSYNVAAGQTTTATPSALRRVFYDGNGSTSGAPPTDAGSYSPGQTVTVRNNTGNLSRSNFVFGGWQTQPSGGTNFTPGQTFAMGSANVTLYALWIPSSTVTINVTLDLGSEDTVVTTVPGTVTRGTPLNVSATSGFDSYRWFLDGPTQVSGAQSALVSTGTLLPGLHTLVVAVTKNGVVTSASCQFTVGNPTGLGINIVLDLGSEDTVVTTVPGTVIRGTPLNVSATSGFDSYRWLLDGPTQIGSAPSAVVATGALLPGLHTLVVAVTKNGVVTSTSCQFTVSNPTGLGINVVLDLGSEDTVATTVPGKVARGTPLNVSATAGFDSYRWYLDGPTQFGSVQSVVLATGALLPGLHTILVAVTKNGVVTSTSCQFTVGNPTGLGIQFVLDLGSDASVTATVPGSVPRGTPLNVSASAGFDSYQWFLDEGQIVAGTVASVSIATGTLLPGRHLLTLVVTKNNLPTSASVRFSVNN